MLPVPAHCLYVWSYFRSIWTFLEYRMLSYCLRGPSGLGSSDWDHWLRQVLTRIYYKQMILLIHSEPVLGEPNFGGGSLDYRGQTVTFWHIKGSGAVGAHGTVDTHRPGLRQGPLVHVTGDDLCWAYSYILSHEPGGAPDTVGVEVSEAWVVSVHRCPLGW